MAHLSLCQRTSGRPQDAQWPASGSTISARAWCPRWHINWVQLNIIYQATTKNIQKLGALILKVFVGPLWKPCLSHSQLLLCLTTCPIPGCLRFLQEMPNGLRLGTGCANWKAPLSTLLPQLEISIYVQSSFVTPSNRGNTCKNIGAQEPTPLFQLSCYIPQRNKFYGNDKHNSKAHSTVKSGFCKRWISMALRATGSWFLQLQVHTNQRSPHSCNEQCNWQSHLRLKD